MSGIVLSLVLLSAPIKCPPPHIIPPKPKESILLPLTKATARVIAINGYYYIVRERNGKKETVPMLDTNGNHVPAPHKK